MLYETGFTPQDEKYLASLNDFVPKKVYDFHMHFYLADHYSRESRINTFPSPQGVKEWKEDLAKYPIFRDRTISSLVIGMPSPDSDQPAINRFIQEQMHVLNDPTSRCLYLVGPGDSQEAAADALRSGAFAGFKVYHCYSGRPDTMNATIPEFVPEWMWELLNEVGGVLLLHMVLPRAIADERNQKDIIRLCEKYPRVQLNMAHLARCFNHRHSLEGLEKVAHLPNVWVDTSAVCEAESFANALRILGPHRMLWGSDYAVSEFRGRCVTMGDNFYWHRRIEGEDKENAKMTYVGIESLLALREALEQFGGTAQDIEDIFWNNALRCLDIPNKEKPEIPAETAWTKAREVISCGTGLLSKRAESFLTPEWPTYYRKASGCRIWDANGRMFIDFVGGVGAVFLGYGDRDVNRAVSRRLTQGSYCSFLPEEEVAVANRLIDLHPGMGKVRYARGGGEAMALAVRLARAATNKSGIAFCGYHGWHDWYLAANLGKSESNRPIPGLNPLGVPAELQGTASPFHYNNLESLQKASDALQGNLAAIVMEPMREQKPTAEFLAKVQEITQRTGALLLIDEVSTGMRCGFPGISSALGLKPDLLVYAKAISNGIPFGVVLGKEGVMEKAEPSFISSSYWTDGLGPAAALAVLDKMQRENIQQRVWAKGETFIKELDHIVKQFPTLQISISGVPVTPKLNYDNGEQGTIIKMCLIEEMLKRGFLLGSIIYLMDAHRDTDLERFLKALSESLSVVAEDLEKGALKDKKPRHAVTIGRLT